MQPAGSISSPPRALAYQKHVNPSANLPHDVFFVCRRPQKWPDLFGDPDADFDVDAMHDRMFGVEENWVVRTYVQLKKRCRNVFLTDRFVPGRICVVSAWELALKNLTFGSFVVGCRADAPIPEMCNFVVVQNEANVRKGTDVFMPHWPQPGLIGAGLSEVIVSKP